MTTTIALLATRASVRQAVQGLLMTRAALVEMGPGQILAMSEIGLGHPGIGWLPVGWAPLRASGILRLTGSLTLASHSGKRSSKREGLMPVALVGAWPSTSS